MIQDHPIRSFFLSLGFLGLAGLAFHPHIVIEIENKLGLSPSAEASPSSKEPISERSEKPSPEAKSPRALPSTELPDIENLPQIPNLKMLARNDVWIGATPCSEHMFAAPIKLSNLSPRETGPEQSEPIKSTDTQWIKDQPTYLYRSERGITLKLVKPVVDYYTVYGQTYRDARKDIFTRRPLESFERSNYKIPAGFEKDIKKRLAEKPKTIDPDLYMEKLLEKRVTTLANISSPSSLSYQISGSRNRFRLNPKQTVLTPSFLITLPSWTKYDQASQSDQEKWDDLLCNAAHHELGHLRIRLDILAETLDSYADLPPAGSFKEMEDIVIAHRKEINARVEARQDVYHIYNGGGTRRGMIERPYAELPFPWLEKGEAKTAERPPE